ncbi:MAG: Mur ligase domain-containing protein [Candidatus Pacebacteria bacterium]|nr:Mur ligase domain-containing protein [Candidatus Paceibacterota bacterium]MDD3047786.1 Mur ligase domain-containing protein [Candidatus Paceibacterota bacterium]
MKIYFIGIGGIGISALAKYYLKKGHRIYGSDILDSEIIQDLKKNGVQITNKLPDNIDLVIYTAAISKQNKIYLKAKKRNIKTLSYPEALAELSKNMFTIAISGTHGKSTTTAMLSLILTEAGLDPTVIVGTKIKEFENNNYRIGNSKYLIIEACEYKDSFLNYHPDIGVILNIEKDHLDYFKNFENIKKSFNQFAKQSKKVILEKQIQELINTQNKIIFDKNKITKPILNIPGEFNILNAMHAIKVADELGIKKELSLKVLSKFKGTWRRMDTDNKSFNFTIINDYAHHPTEIKETLKAIREKYKTQKIYCIFQPHQYERTLVFSNEFENVLKNALLKEHLNKLFLYPIYTAEGRESPEIKKQINSEKLVSKINHKNCAFIKNFEEAKIFIKNTLKENNVLIIMGAGNIYNLYLELLSI